jgi:hypothetical protein
MQCQIRKHDDRQFEVKIAYPLRRDVGRGRHALDLFLFLPYPLGVDPGTYPAEQFYNDLRTYTRFKTPDIALRALLDAGEAASPLTRVSEMLRAGREQGRWDERRLVYELKVLANVIRAQVRDSTRAVRRNIRRGEWGRVRARVGKLCAGLNAVLERLAALTAEMESAGVPAEVKRTARLAKEYVLVQSEGMLLRLLERSGQAEAAIPDAAEAAKTLRETVRGLPPREGPNVADAGDSRGNEYFLHRESLLKKFCAEVLFLSVEQRSGAKPAQHILFGIAAALAMGIAIGAAALVGKRFPQGSVPFATAVIVAYVLKDRIKELIREYGSRLLPRWVSDRKGRLVDPQMGDHIGETSESMRWRTLKDVPAEVMEARHAARPQEDRVYTPPEDVIHYSKEVELDHGAIYRRHQRAAAIDDIIRLQVGRWLTHMDDPRKRLLRLGDSGKVEALQAPRVYHVNMVARFGALDSGKPQLRRVRLVLSKNGIERVEHEGLSRKEAAR